MVAYDRLFDVCVAVAPPMDEQALKSVPAKRGVFALLDADDQPILVATAADIRSRLRYRLTAPEGDQPGKAADLRAITAKVCWRLTWSRFETDWRYLESVRRIRPDSYGELLPKRAAWFIAVDPSAEIPAFTVEAGITRPGRHFGLFSDRRSAEAFIEGLTDAFDLCRCVSILRQAPAGIACVYKQMGRCAAPCDGSSSMEAYRVRINRAIEFAAGDHQTQRALLIARMQDAAAAMGFETAAVFKSRLERLAELGEARYAQVRDAAEFRFVIIQRGPSSHQACTFVCDGGRIAAGPLVEFPPVQAQMAEVLAACDRLADDKEDGDGEADRRRMGLVASHLFSRHKDDGLILSRVGLTADRLVRALTDASERLRLRPPRRQRAKHPDAKPDTEDA